MLSSLLVLLSALVFAVSARAEAGENVAFIRGDALYQHGKGDPDGFGKALEAFEKASADGNARAQFYVGRMYQLGHGGAVDLKKAEHWYRLAAEKGDALAWNNLGNVRSALGRGGNEILDCFRRAFEMGNVMGAYNLGIYYQLGGREIEIDYVQALAWFRKTVSQQPDYPDALHRIGYILQYGGHGVERDLKAAEQAYLTSIQTTENAHSYHNLYCLYEAGSLPSNDGRALELLKQKVRNGSADFAYKVGKTFRRAPRGKEDLVAAAFYYDIAAGKNHGLAAHALAFWKDKKVLDFYGNERKVAWKARYQEMRSAANKEVNQDLKQILPIFNSGDEVGAAQALNQALERWKTRTVDGYAAHHLSSSWYAAYTGKGRENAEWGRFLFGWLIGIYETDRNYANQIITARNSFHGKLIDLGRYGMLRQSCSETKRLILEIEGVDVDAVLGKASVGPDYEVKGGEGFPMKVDYETALRSWPTKRDSRLSRGDLIGGAAMTQLLDFSVERLSVGDWESVLKMSDWMERWNVMVAASGKEPKRSYPDCAAELDQASEELKVGAYSALGLHERAAAACEVIIGQNHKGTYGGRRLHRALYRLAGIRVDQGRAAEVDIEQIRTLEEKMQANRHETSDAWQFAKVVRARVLAVRNWPDEGYAVVNEVLTATTEVTRPVLRLEALLVLAELKLNAGATDGVPDLLEEALSWARANGLLLQELRIYEQYARYLIAIGDYRQALEMQRRVIELIDALKLSPRRERALLRLAEIHAMLEEAEASRILLEEIKDPALAEDIKALRDDLEDQKETPAKNPVVIADSVTLQPMGIRTLPLRDEAGAIFILTNPNPEPRSVNLTVNSESLNLKVDEASPQGVFIQCSAAPGEHQLSMKTKVPGESQVPVELSASDLASIRGDAVIGLKANEDGNSAVQESVWTIRQDGEESLVAVVDAARLRHNAFFLVPVYHYLSTPQGSPATVDLRVVASEPTRVEGYTSDGTLLFVDAQGNGSFGDPGDLLATEKIHELFPVMAVGEEDALICLRYRPVSGCANGRVEIRIETRLSAGQGDWKADSVDWLEP